MEEKTLTAQERSLVLEKELFEALIKTLQQELNELSILSDRLSLLDALLSLTKTADEYGYVRPELSCDSVIAIRDGRHPVIETLTDKPFVTNSVSMGVERMLVITGPNMGGKSTYMRQTALICIMARAGSFVPASSALIGDIDRIFTRIGASDDLVSGRSTFMVEMEEASSILNNATTKSLVLMDEIGRGTSAVEGAALAYAIAVHLCSRLGCLSLFSTHYSEIGTLESNYPQVRNLCFKAEESHGKICFLYHVNPGSISHSYAVEVGKLAGLPADVISMAKNMIGNSEIKNQQKKSAVQAQKQTKTEKSAQDLLTKEAKELITATDTDNLTPLQALNLLVKIKGMLKD